MDESRIVASTPREFALRAALEKWRDVVASLPTPSVVVAADTVVCFDCEERAAPAETSPPAPPAPRTRSPRRRLAAPRRLPAPRRVIFGKPADPLEAVCMLRQLSGRTHEVITALAVGRSDRCERGPRTGTETSRVRFRELSDEEIKTYVAAGESLDKAGAYAVQGEGARFIESVDGDLNNVIGLPLRLLAQLLAPDYPALRIPQRAAFQEESGPPRL